ncbi:uncharacterized protein EV154DRAFT_515989 [Mucor mucedo]|uniref:uncharacterized protein n=1 Tax=Mucor mucedo TaxID=29922 RepID=UPI00221F1AFF|nr:uncharacterized protein EV154DRAFT_515989 [Mucor mucedo]KAI7888934.1 hypothetical protein EV154DRAFT_515989 [Mucor mucedo]
MTNSLPNRNSISPVRKNNNNTMPTKRHQPLKIITTTSDEIVSSPTSSVRQRLSSLFRASSPVVLSLKETFHNKRISLSTVSFSPPTVTEEEEESPQQAMEPLDDSHSTSSSTTSSVHMPRSPIDAREISTVWQPSVTVLSYEEVVDKTAAPELPTHFAITRSSSSLAYQVNQILGSTLEEVDEEIDQDWEISRNLLRQSLVLSVKL